MLNRERKNIRQGYRKERLDRGIKSRSDSIYALSSFREAIYLLLPRSIIIIGTLFLPLVLDVYWIKVLILVCVVGILALSWDFIAQSGMFSLGQALFFGVGGYVAGAVNYYTGLPPILTIPLATIFGGVVCTILIIPVLRLRGIYFAMVTFILPLMISRLIETSGLLGGVAGLSALSSLPNIWVSAYLIIIAFLICLFGFRRLMDTDYGIILKGINGNDFVVMSGGINIYWYKIQALFIGTSAAAFTGAYMTHYYQFVGISAFGQDNTILPIAAVVLGGPGTFAGAALGSFILVPLTELLRAIGTWRVVLYAFTLVVFIVVLPEGIFHYIQRKYHQYEKWVKVE